MKTRWELYCELRNFDNWCLRNPVKAHLLSCLTALVMFGVSQLIRILHAEFLLGLLLLGALTMFLVRTEQ